jgi:acyl-ACP thioesterase
VVEYLPLNEGLDALPPEERVVPSLAAFEHLQAAGERRAVYSDLDSNGHMNNARYIQWIQDMSDVEVLEKAETMHFIINYIAEIHPEETISLFSSAETGAGSSRLLCYEGRRGDTAVFRAKLQCGLG